MLRLVPGVYIINAQDVLAIVTAIGIINAFGVIVSVCRSVKEAHWEVIISCQDWKGTQP